LKLKRRVGTRVGKGDVLWNAPLLKKEWLRKIGGNSWRKKGSEYGNYLRSEGREQGLIGVGRGPRSGGERSEDGSKNLRGPEGC